MGTFREICQYYRDYRLLAIISISASSIFELIDLLVPYAIGQILNVLSGQGADGLIQLTVTAIASSTGLPDQQTTALIILLGIIFLVTVIKAPIQPWLGSWFHWLIPLAARRDQHHNAIQKILTLPLEFYEENNPGRIANRITKGITNHTWTYPEIAGQLIPKLVRVIGIFIVIFFIQWQIAIFFLVSFVFILSFTLIKLRQIIRLETRLDSHQENTESRNSEIITNIKTVKAFATENQELQRQSTRLNRELTVVIHRIHRDYVKLATYQTTTVQFCLFMVLGFTLFATLGGQMSLGYFVVTYTLASMAYSELTPISLLAEVFARRYSSMVRFYEFMQLKDGQDAIQLNSDDNQVSYQFKGQVKLENLTFGYLPEKPVLQDINLLIEPCQTVALVGHSGSGKSTLVKLLFRYFEPSQGRILIDDKNIQDLNVTAYRRRLAIVHQDVDIFNGTLLNNLTYGNPKATLDEVNEACKIARADEFINQLEKGYYTTVGERGMRLSGGQKQRLGIARALLVNPDILIFDEATSSLDYESERSIQIAMQNILGTRTTIIVAHRLSTIREADKIVVLDNGKIIEIGSHDELLNNRGIYRRLHALQETGDVI
ncbi:ABC transporter ATP-binding protein [Arthrospira platensis]|mgnify:CR=1 FL=1|uniref:ABC transporter ATP-binding protein n=1 Tax=Limnospira platensis NIES-46 TaxID=1236695 RepID=A0A5M3T321_LIMPL|nr:ABC transporter ATP-binding protein [Arthrospira platensis]AMW31685.1 ABC transporter ATP-binding protein [Arthrospira platensis YZ]MBD2671572.1 ABC transporter ATP-binding protein [Arthrospira platensis FACHB-439]MBD2712384.1 ABC transporter ATP-binding protein [Arthrospira platensis FACHB-835]MDF2213129.1 ABC transporter ATP-binding protein [Arthrospira platensis NCB002]MDT9184921.1 ABC transporter ATP-binding protein [Limnospira sp. PMC 289.06]MDT9297105.1 ABC transporter ATP-binding pr